MDVQIIRTYYPNLTLGIFTARDTEKIFNCATLEKPWLNNQHDISCIPEGDYICKYTQHPKHGWVYQIMNVANDRTDVLLHVGNFVKDTLGCILIGSKVDVSGESIDGSKQAFDKFMEFMKGIEEFKLNITSIPL